MIEEARQAGARIKLACALIGIDIRTQQRWQKGCCLKDKRCGPLTEPANKLTPEERATILQAVNQSEYCNLPPSQIVPKLADQGIYLASVSSMNRILKEEKQAQHRNASRPRQHAKPEEWVSDRPGQLWSWDITYLPSTLRGQHFYLYLFLDAFSRKIVGADVFDCESAEHAAAVVTHAYQMENLKPGEIVLHSDNGSPMKGATMLATLQMLGIQPSRSRPSVSNDNPYSESLFKTLKYCPQYPINPFHSLEEARAWVCSFVSTYNQCHHHSGINFVTPNERHEGLDISILAHRTQVFELAKQKNPFRWSGKTRNWSRPETVTLNKKKRIGRQA